MSFPFLFKLKLFRKRQDRRWKKSKHFSYSKKTLAPSSFSQTQPEIFINSITQFGIIKKKFIHNPLQHCLLITSNKYEHSQQLSTIKVNIEKAGFKVDFFYVDSETNLNNIQLNEMAKKYETTNCDFLVGYGNNFIFSCVKYCHYFIQTKKTITKQITFSNDIKKPIPLVFIGSTLNINLSLNNLSIFYNQQEKNIYQLFCKFNIPIMVVADCSLIQQPASSNEIAIFSLLVETIETYISVRHFFGDVSAARKAMQIFVKTMQTKKIDDTTMIGSFLNACAVHRSWLGFSHAISFAIANLLKQPYDTIVCWIYPYVLEYVANKSTKIRSYFALIADIIGFECLTLDDISKTHECLSKLIKMSDKLIDASKLRSLMNGINEHDLKKIVNMSMLNILSLGSPIVFSKKDVLNIIHNVLNEKSTIVNFDN